MPFEIRTGIERGGNETEGDVDVLTNVSFIVHNHKTNQTSAPIKISVESNRDAFFSVPAEFLSGGDFDVIVRCVTNDHYIGLFTRSLSMVAARESFNLNLLKSLLIMWFMSVGCSALSNSFWR